MINTTADIPPNQTLFCYNLSTKIHIIDLRNLLFEFFSPYGKVIDVVASKADPKKRGNAFIVFSEIGSATAALRDLQGREFLGRVIGINYGKTKSDKVAMLEGTYKIRKRKAADQAMVPSTADASIAPPPEKRAAPSAPPGASLFVENLPSMMTGAALAMLFKQYLGYQRVSIWLLLTSMYWENHFYSYYSYFQSRLVEGRCVAFVDFTNEIQAEVAMRGLNGFLVTKENPLKISIAKK